MNNNNSLTKMNISTEFLPYNLTNTEHPSLIPDLKAINECAETKAECLEILRTKLKSLQDIETCLEDSFLLKFLRVSKFNPTKAFQRILKHYQQMETVFNSIKEISLPIDKAILHGNYALCSPYRLKDNSLVFIALGGKIDYSKITFAERFYLDSLALNGMLDNPVNQITRIVAIFDYKGFNLRSFLAHTPGWCKLFVESFLNCSPVRFQSGHIVNAPSLFLTVFNIVHPFFPKKLKDRIFVHSNDGWKSLHSKVPPEVLPTEFGGNLKFESLVNLFENIDDLEDRFHKMMKYGYVKTKDKRQKFRPLCRKS